MKKLNLWRYIAITFASLLFASPVISAERVKIAQFSQGSLDEWEEKSFVDHTRYQFVTDGERRVMEAIADKSASGMFREIEIDLNKTPYLNWSWWIEDTLKGNNEKSKQGDDYPARIYVVVSGGLFFWKTRAVNYVWSNSQPVDSDWPNAYTGNAKMVAVRSGDEQRGQWVTEKRNVRDDLRRLFGEEIEQIDAVAIMSDTDNSGGRARARYGDIFFSSQ